MRNCWVSSWKVVNGGRWYDYRIMSLRPAIAIHETYRTYDPRLAFFRPKCKTLVRPEASTSYRTSDAGRTTAILTYVRSAFVNSYSEYAEVVRFMGPYSFESIVGVYRIICVPIKSCVTTWLQQFCNIVTQQLQLRTGIRPPTNSYYCTAVRPQLNNLVRATVHSAYQHSQSTNVQAEIDRPVRLRSSEQAHSERYLSFRLSGEPNNTSRSKNNGIFGVDSF